MNVKDDPEIKSESEPETEVEEVSTVQAQRATDCLKQYIIKSNISQDLNDDFIAAAEKLEKFLTLTTTQESTQTKITDYFK